MNRVEFLAKLTTRLFERVFGDRLPEYGLSVPEVAPDLTSDDVGFFDVVCYEVVDSVPQLSREAEE